MNALYYKLPYRLYPAYVYICAEGEGAGRAEGPRSAGEAGSAGDPEEDSDPEEVS